MTETLLTTLLPALELAVFRRDADGSFTAVAPPPKWFPRLADVTFPFLGHILDEATAFWHAGTPGTREFGPCAETDESGREFHYQVKALTVDEGGGQFLVFELDAGSDRLRETLQKAREHALGVEQNRAKRRQAAADIHRLSMELRQLVLQLSEMSSNPAQTALVKSLQTKCEALIVGSATLE